MPRNLTLRYVSNNAQDEILLTAGERDDAPVLSRWPVRPFDVVTLAIEHAQASEWTVQDPDGADLPELGRPLTVADVGEELARVVGTHWHVESAEQFARALERHAPDAGALGAAEVQALADHVRAAAERTGSQRVRFFTAAAIPPYAVEA